MDEAEVRQWLVDRFGVSRETLDRLARFAELLIDEAGRQNLIARSTIPDMWDRHIRDSAQLLLLAPSADAEGEWLDLGSGPGLPGIVLALLGRMRMTLVESRRGRIAFLHHTVDALDLADRVDVQGCRVESLARRPYDVLTARAFAPLDRLFGVAHPFAHRDTTWLLPKGRSAQEELDAARRSWQGDFATVPSVTHSEASIIVARNVRPRRRA